MKSRLVFPLFCLVVGLVVFGVSYSVLGQGPGAGPGEDETPGPGGNVNDPAPPDPTPTPTPGRGDDDGEVGPVASVNELHRAVLGGDVSAVRDLLAAGADPNAPDDRGRAALHFAIPALDDSPIAYGKIQALLEYGANPNLGDDAGFLPLMHASAMQEGQAAAAMAALLAAGGDPLVKNGAHASEKETTYRPENIEELRARGLFFTRAKRVFPVMTHSKRKRQKSLKPFVTSEIVVIFLKPKNKKLFKNTIAY